MLLLHNIIVVDLQQLVDDELVVRHVGVVQPLDVVENLVNLLDTLGGANPELAFWALEALGLDILNLHDGEVPLLTPLELLVEEVEHRKVKTPHIVSTRKVNVVVRVQTREGDRTAEVSVFAFGQRRVFAI